MEASLEGIFWRWRRNTSPRNPGHLKLKRQLEFPLKTPKGTSPADNVMLVCVSIWWFQTSGLQNCKIMNLCVCVCVCVLNTSKFMVICYSSSVWALTLKNLTWIRNLTSTPEVILVSLISIINLIDIIIQILTSYILWSIYIKVTALVFSPIWSLIWC